MVSTTEAISIAELIVYIPIFFLTLFIVFRHGFQRQMGWIYLVIFCTVRCAGAGFKIASANDPTNVTDLEWSAILQSVGLSPLLLASLGLLKRVCDNVSNHVRSENNNNYQLPGVVGGLGRKIITKRATANSRRSRIIQVTQLPAMIALILCIVGGIDQSHTTKPSDISTGHKYTKIGVIIFLVVYLILAVMAIITMKDVGNAQRGDKGIYFAVLAALPLLAVRLLWSILCAFTTNSKYFSLTSNKPLVQLFMAVLEEFFIVCMYTFVGLIAGKPREY